MSIGRNNATNLLKNLLQDAGFEHIGVSKADFMDPEARRLEAWLNAGNHGKMAYMENHFDKRVDPRKLVPGARSVVVMTYNYFPEEEINEDGSMKVARYAYGRDYHKVIRKKLKGVMNELNQTVGKVEGRFFVDSGPVLERDWARRSGVGWVGKNTLLIHPKQGSYFFLAEMILDIELEYDDPIKDHCGTCTRCIDACPTDAISPTGYILDASKCISYLTIELKEAIPDEFKEHMEGWIFGCDICQEVCPWNRFSKPHQEPAFEPNTSLKEMTDDQWEQLTEQAFDNLFAGSAVRRTGFKGLSRNIRFINGDSGGD